MYRILLFSMKGQLLHITPSKPQAHILMRWIGCQRFIYNAKVQDDRYFRTFARKSLQLVGKRAKVAVILHFGVIDKPLATDPAHQDMRLLFAGGDVQ